MTMYNVLEFIGEATHLCNKDNIEMKFWKLMKNISGHVSLVFFSF